METFNVNEPIQWSPGVTLEAIERQVVLKAYRHFKKNKTATAAALGIAIRTLDNKLEKYEADEKAEVERKDNAKSQREQFLARCRGGGKQLDNVYSGANAEDVAKQRELAGKTERGGVFATAGVGVESVASVAAKPSVPVPQRKKV